MNRFLQALAGIAFIFIPLINGYSQVNITSMADGDWTTPATWDCTCVPDFNVDTITIAPNHNVTISTTIQADELVISGDGILTIASAGRLIVLNGDGFDLTQEASDIGQGTSADGRVVIQSGGVLENRGLIASIASAMIFSNGAEYQHNQGRGVIPEATWQLGSTCRITGWTSENGTVPSTFGESLAQSFYNFIWDCAGQTAVFVGLNGYLTTVNGDLIINNTNPVAGVNANRSITLGFTGPTIGGISILGNFIVTNTAKVTLNSSGTYTVDIAGNAEFSSTADNSTSVNYTVTSAGGTTNLNIDGDLMLNSGQLNLSQANGTTNINIEGDFALNGGSIHKSGSVGIGNILFSGSAAHNLTVGTGTFTASHAINYTVGSNGTLNLEDPAAFVGNLTVQNGATLNLNADLSVGGDMVFDAGSFLNPNNGTLTLNGQFDQTVSGGGKTLHNLVIDKTNETNIVNLTNSLSLTGKLSVSENSTLFSNGNLRLKSTSDAATGNASIGPLLNGASVNGDVIVERYMSSEGRIYRYLSSPVEELSIADLQAYFPITGGFTGSSSCQGCTTNPSFYYYDAMTAAYVSFPTAAITEDLIPGRGYSAFIRQNVIDPPGPITLEMTGPIYQGDVSLPVFHNTTATESWNLVGNPYPSSINWDFPAEGWTKTNINGQIAVRDNGEGLFQYWNGSAGGLTNGRIAAGQAFWVQTTGSNPEIIIHEEAKTDTTASFFREGQPDVMVVKLSKGSLWDKAYFQIHRGAAADFDYYDAPKLVNDNFDLSTRFENTSQLAINAVNEVPCDQELFIDLRFTKTDQGAFVVSPPGNYTLDFEVLGSKLPQYKITLRDLFTGAETDIANNTTYSFSITEDPVSMAANRLKLIFKYKIDAEISIAEGDILSSNFETGNQWFLNDQKIKGADEKTLQVERSGKYTLEVTIGNCTTTSEMEYAVTATSEEFGSSVQVYPNPTSGEIFVNTPRQTESISLMNSLGQEIGTFAITDTATAKTGYLNVRHLTPGIYFLKASFRERNVVVKIIKI